MNKAGNAGLIDLLYAHRLLAPGIITSEAAGQVILNLPHQFLQYGIF
jgi:hypothetical protein